MRTKEMLCPFYVADYFGLWSMSISGRFTHKTPFLHGNKTLLYDPSLYLIFLYFKSKTNHEF